MMAREVMPSGPSANFSVSGPTRNEPSSTPTPKALAKMPMKSGCAPSRV